MASKTVPKVCFGKFDNYGQHIYLYKHIHTNQVVYSLTQVMNNAKILDQLPFYGKKTRPRALRRDHWRPFASVTFPPYVSSAKSPIHPVDLTNNSETVRDANFRDGLRLFQTLREMRVLRDYAWRRIPHLNKKISAEKGKSKRAMMNELKDQRATAVADLAKALFMQQEWANAEHQDIERKLHVLIKLQRDRWVKIEGFAKGMTDGRLEAVEKGIDRNQARLEHARQQGKKDGDEELAELQRRIIALKTERNRIIRCKDAVDYVNGMAVPDEKRKEWSKTLSAIIDEELGRRQSPQRFVAKLARQVLKGTQRRFLMGHLRAAEAEVSSTVPSSTRTVQPVSSRKVQASERMESAASQPAAASTGAAPTRNIPLQAAAAQSSEPEPAIQPSLLHEDFAAAEEEYAAAAKRVGWIPPEDTKPWIHASGYAPAADLFLEHRRYVWKIKGSKFFSDTHTIGYPKGEALELPRNAIKIKWLDIRDAQFAKEWPGNVYHAQMGLLGRHTAYTMPHPDAGPIFEVNAKPDAEEELEEGVELDGEVNEEPPKTDGDGEGEKDGEEKKGMWSRIASAPSNIMARLSVGRRRLATA